MVLMRGHEICFYGELWLIIPKLSLFPLLIWSSEITQAGNMEERPLTSGDLKISDKRQGGVDLETGHYLGLLQEFQPKRAHKQYTVKILKIGTPKIIIVIVLQMEQLDFTVQYCVQKMQTEKQTE